VVASHILTPVLLSLPFFGTLPGSHFLSQCQALCDSALISSMVSNRHPFSFNLIFGNRVPNHGSTVGGG
jgi:hypothetical protein